MKKQAASFPSQLITSLIGFAALGAGLAILIPNYTVSKYLGRVTTDERALKLGLMAYLLFALTAIVLWIARRALKLPVSWFLSSLLFNGVIVFIKFISSPNTYAGLSSSALVGTTVGVGLLYFVGLYLIYLFSEGSILTALSKQAKSDQEVKFLFAAGLFVFINFLRILVFSLPPFSHTTTATYLSSIFKGGGLVLSLLLFLIIVGAVEAFDKAKQTKGALKNVWILSVTILIMYHILWAIFVSSLGSCTC